MPAPHRRNRGESLAHHVDANARARTVSDGRDNLVAARTRKDAKWEEAAARLSPSEERAKPPVVVLRPGVPTRYWLGHCLRCSRDIWVHTAKPRLPFCGPKCSQKYREAKR